MTRYVRIMTLITSIPSLLPNLALHTILTFPLDRFSPRGRWGPNTVWLANPSRTVSIWRVLDWRVKVVLT